MPKYQPTIAISHSEGVTDDIVSQYYAPEAVHTVLVTTLTVMATQQSSGLVLPYFQDITAATWLATPKALDVYITDVAEAKALNSEARGKDYATNILSYPSELPSFILTDMPHIPLGELIICHEVVFKEANAQNKSVADHVTHLLVHGILHLLGFDHELGQAQQDEMESFEVAILTSLGVANPYILR